jgi:hypothetical protein
MIKQSRGVKKIVIGRQEVEKKKNNDGKDKEKERIEKFFVK